MIIRPVDPAARPVSFDWNGYDAIEGGVGGWESLDRPRNSAAAEWIGEPAKTLTLPLILDGIEKGGLRERGVRPGPGTSGPGVDVSVQPAIAAVTSWGVKHPATGRPPVLSVLGSRYTTPVERWVVQDIEWADPVTNDNDQVVQQELTLTLLRFIEPTLAVGPAAKIRASKPKPKDEKGKKKRRKRRKRK